MSNGKRSGKYAKLKMGKTINIYHTEIFPYTVQEVL